MRITTETRENCEIYDVLLCSLVLAQRFGCEIEKRSMAIYFLHLTPNYVRQVNALCVMEKQYVTAPN